MKQKLAAAVPVALVCVLGACTVTSLPTETVSGGKPVAWSEMVRRVSSTPKGPVRFTKVKSADWSVVREGLINLKHPKAVAAGLKKGDEPIEISFYVVEHPTQGRFILDTGLGQVFRQSPDAWPVSGIIKSFMKMETLKIHRTLGEWMRAQGGTLTGVFLTHTHMDHILGSGDAPTSVPFFVGPRETRNTRFMNSFVQGSTDRILGAGRRLRELSFPAPTGPEALAVLDYFGDGSFYVIHSPGHTAGSLVFVVLATDGRHLVLGDTSHTKWGWENTVEPGDFTEDHKTNAESLVKLKKLAETVGAIQAYPGHQSL